MPVSLFPGFARKKRKHVIMNTMLPQAKPGATRMSA
jgi:hypothetical protein